MHIIKSDKMKTIKKKIEILRIKYDPIYEWITINWGVLVFHLLKGKMMIDETPYSDEHLVPIENLKIENNNFMFESYYKKQQTLFIIDCSTFDVGIEVAKLIKSINENGIDFSKEYDTFEFIYEKDRYCVKLENEKREERIVISYNRYRNFFTYVYPEPKKEFLIDKCYYSNKSVYVKCKGKNLRDDKDDTLNYEYKWTLNSSMEIFEKLLDFGFSKVEGNG